VARSRLTRLSATCQCEKNQCPSSLYFNMGGKVVFFESYPPVITKFKTVSIYIS
jgi:hypothetical protein